MKEINSQKEMFVNTLVLAIIILVIAVFFWPNDAAKSQSNKLDKSKTQIKVLVKRINIRKEPTINSEDIGDVYKDEIYTVLDNVDAEEYYWYKIETSKNVVGYIASDPKSEYVDVISGYIDRTAPEIIFSKDFLLFEDGKENFESVTCVDEHSSCTLTHEYLSQDYVRFKAKDEKNNESEKDIKYYKVYKFNESAKETSQNINASYNFTNEDNEIEINAKYVLNKDISSENKSINYTPIITLYDDSFNEVKIYTTYSGIEEDTINNYDMSLKEEYIDKDLTKDNAIGIKYIFKNNQSNIKYVRVGFIGVENYNNDANLLAYYYSRYYAI